LQILIS